jgi:hypothetical protein
MFFLFYNNLNMKQMLFLKLVSFFFLVGCATPHASHSMPTGLDDTWSGLFLEQSKDDFTYGPLMPSSEESEVGITTIFSLTQANSIVGFAFQATVDGNGGRQSVTFRLTIYENKFQGFQVTNHREHNGFGVKQINALTNQLPGTNASFNDVNELLIQANAGRTGISETYDGMMPVIELMTERYLSL